MQTWDEDDVTNFIGAATKSPYYGLFPKAVYTGMRRSKLTGIKWRDVDFILSQIYVSRSRYRPKDGSYIFAEPKSAKS